MEISIKVPQIIKVLRLIILMIGAWYSSSNLASATHKALRKMDYKTYLTISPFPAYPIIERTYLYTKFATTTSFWIAEMWVEGYTNNPIMSPYQESFGIPYLLFIPPAALTGLIVGTISGKRKYERLQKEGEYIPLKYNIGGTFQFCEPGYKQLMYESFIELPNNCLKIDRLRLGYGLLTYKGLFQETYLAVTMKNETKKWKYDSEQLYAIFDHYWWHAPFFIFYSGIVIGYAQTYPYPSHYDERYSKTDILLKVNSGIELRALQFGHVGMELSCQILGPVVFNSVLKNSDIFKILLRWGS